MSGGGGDRTHGPSRPMCARRNTCAAPAAGEDWTPTTHDERQSSSEGGDVL